jgi:capsid portal protein
MWFLVQEPNGNRNITWHRTTLTGATSPKTYYARVIGDCGTAEASFTLQENGPVKNVTANRFYCTIQSAITAASNNDVIEVSAGTFEEALTIDKSLTILGANANVSPNSGSRNPETVLKPNFTTLPNGTYQAITGNAANITVVFKGFTVDMTNTLLMRNHGIFVPIDL